MRFTLASLVLASAVALSACSDDDNTGPSTQPGRIRVVHASPDAPAVDVLVDGAVVLQDVPFTAGSNYLTVPTGGRNIKVRVGGTATTVIDATPTIAPRTDYTILAVDRVANISPLVLTDDNTAPPAGQFKIRVVHAAPSAPNVDVYATTPGGALTAQSRVLTNVPFKAASSYLSVPAGTYQFTVTPTGTTTVAIQTGGLTFAAGQIRTVIAVDNAGGGAPFGLLAFADAN